MLRLVVTVSIVAGGLALPGHGARAAGRVVLAVSSTNVYADVISQIGGAHVAVFSILSNPSIDPHAFESTTTDADAAAKATFVVQNGLGYDAFMVKLEGASPNTKRTVLDVAARLGYKVGDNPHLWRPSPKRQRCQWLD